uniref:Uncharacterized protein n=1 Tax=Panagrolaimus sp. ES5 TaxID=591445 RepID=A0AC34GVR9_9BILA
MQEKIKNLSFPSFDGINVVIYAGDEHTKRLINHRTPTISQKLCLKTCPSIDICGGINTAALNTCNNNNSKEDDSTSSEKCAKILFERLKTNAPKLRCKRVMLLKG